MPAEQLKKIVDEERASQQYPREAQEKNQPKSRRRKHADDVEDDDLLEELASFLYGAPEEIREQVYDAMRRGESAEEILLRVLKEHILPARAGGARRERPTALPPPEQGSSFRP